MSAVLFSPSCGGTAVQARGYFQTGEFPSSHHREEGWPSDQEILRSIRFSRGRGGVPIDGTRNTTPAASIRRLRAIFLMTPPPLLAVMRGGEFALFKMRPLNHILLSQPRWARLSTNPATLTWTDVRGGESRRRRQGVAHTPSRIELGRLRLLLECSNISDNIVRRFRVYARNTLHLAGAF